MCLMEDTGPNLVRRSARVGCGLMPNSIARGRKSGREMKQGVLESDIKNQADILDDGPRQVFENGNEVQKLIIVGIREPTADGDGMLGVEDVRGW